MRSACRVAGLIAVGLAVGLLAAAAGEPPAAPAAGSWSTCAPGEVEEQSDCVVMPVVLENVKPVAIYFTIRVEFRLR